MSNNFDWKKIAGVSAVIWVLSLPIAIWRSSHIGKLIYIALFLVIISKCVTPITNIYLNLTALSQARSEIKPVLKNIEALKAKNRELTEYISNVNRQYDLLVDEKLKKITDSLAEKTDPINQKLDEIDKAADILKETERDGLKKRVVDLKEQVKLYKHSIDESSIRMECEYINKKMYLLTEDEKQRFFKDLKDIGFQTEQLEDRSIKVYNGGWSMISSDSSVFSGGFATADSVSYSYPRNGRYRQE